MVDEFYRLAHSLINSQKMSKRIRKIASVTIAISTTLWLSGAVAVLPAAAQSIQDLLNQIAALQAQLVALQAQQTGGAGACAFTRSLTIGSQGTDVQCLQKYLNSAGYQIAASGVGSPGNETTYFGPLTRAAVAKWQAANAVSPAAGYFGSLSRAKYSSIVGGAPGVSPVPVGALVVSVDPLLAGGTLVADSGSTADGAQALAEVLRLSFSGSARVTQLRLHRIGISTDSDFSNAYLYDGATRIAEAPAVASGYFTFTNSAGLFNVSGTKVISFKVDVANNTSVSGKSFQFGIMAASDVVSNAVSVSGAFPFHGPESRMAGVSDLGKLTLSAASPSASTAVDPGQTNYEVFRFNAQASDQKVQVSYLKLTLVGTADYDALQNLKLYVDGSQVGSTAALMNSDKTVVFDLSSAPVEFSTGATKTFALRADVIKGAARNYYFQIQNSADIVAKDLGYGVFIKVNQADVWSIFKAAGTTSINQGSLSIQKSSDSPTGPLALNATNVEISKFDFKAVGEDIKLTNITIRLATSSSFTTAEGLKNVKLVLDGVQIGTTQSSLAGGSDQAYNPGGSFIVPAGVTKKLSVYADLSSGTSDALDPSDVIEADLRPGSGNALRMSSGSTFDAPASAAAGNAIAASSGALGVTKNASVANVSTVKGASGIIIGSWLITGPSEQGVNMTGVTIQDNATSSTQGLGSAFDVLTLWSGGVQYGQTINAPSAASGSAVTFSFSTALNIPAGQSKQVDLKANILTTASVADWNGTSDEDAVRVTAVSTTGVVTNSAVSFSGSVVGQRVAVAGAATLTIAVEASPTMPDSTYLVAGDIGQTLAAWKFSANNTEDVKVTRVKVYEVGDKASATASDNPGNLKNLKLFVDGVQVGATVPAFTVSAATSTLDAATLDNVVFEDAASGLFTVPKNSSKTLVLKADITENVNYSPNADGASAKQRLEVTDGTASAITDVSGKGATSGSLVTLESGASATNALNSSDMRVTKTKPTFALVSPASNTLLPVADVEVIRFRVTAHSAEDVLLTEGAATSTLRFTLTVSGTLSTSTGYKLYDAGSGLQIGANVTASGITTGSTATFSDWGTGSGTVTTIPKGTTKEFYVWANLSGLATVGNSFKLSIKNAAGDLVWSDNSSASAQVEDDNYVGIGLPVEGSTFVKP